MPLCIDVDVLIQGNAVSSRLTGEYIQFYNLLKLQENDN